MAAIVGFTLKYLNGVGLYRVLCAFDLNCKGDVRLFLIHIIGRADDVVSELFAFPAVSPTGGCNQAQKQTCE